MIALLELPFVRSYINGQDDVTPASGSQTVFAVIEYSDAWLQKYGSRPVMDCDSEFMRQAYLYSDRPRMLCGRLTYAACGSLNLGGDIFQV